jgi:SAM-dependent methyltransferase
VFGVIGSGRCGFCGHTGEFVVAEKPVRENHNCQVCRAPLRYRLQASAITAAYEMPDAPFTKLIEQKSFRGLAIYEPGIIGPFRRKLSKVAGYVNSYFWPDVALGNERDGVRCEDLRRLTFPDASIDLVISSDIFEHVRGPMPAFAELFRVLRPGGFHIFTVPLRWPLPSATQPRVDWSGDEDVLLLPARYHGSPHDPKGSLVYTDFGMDLPEELRELGFETATHHGYRQAVTFVSRKPG